MIQRTGGARAVCQSARSGLDKLINEMNKDSKDGQEKVRELLVFYGAAVCHAVTTH